MACTLQLCAEVQEDILKVVVDLPEQRANAASQPLRAGSEPGAARDDDDEEDDEAEPDTGRWRCIVDTAAELSVPKYTGLNLELKVRPYPQ